MPAAYIFCPSYVLNKGKIHIPEVSGDIYIAADSGAETAAKLGVSPNVFIGDFDSIARSFPPGAEVIRYPAQKNDTDLMLAVKYALGLGYKSIAVIGGLDGRMDHTLANLFYLRYINTRGAAGYITDGCNRVTYLSQGYVKIYKDYKYISVIPVSPEIRGLTMAGFRYPLRGAVVSFEEPYTISNEISEGSDYGKITIAEGEALICECDDV